MKKRPLIKSKKTIAQTRIFAVEELQMQFSNGEERIYERLKAGTHGAVMIIPVLDDEHFLLIKEYAAGVENYELAFPKGLIETAEAPELAANRELQEETGYAAKQLDLLKQISLAPGYLSHKMFLVLARDLYESSLKGDEPEPIEVVKWRFDQIDQLLAHEDFTEARSIAALYLLQRYLQMV
ncbi:ADP compounds hydrolase NudE [Kangiella sp. TOML190]|uniref:ADP compounds hydrolase NudE n=1 Tax=Kangiella sp. TOML190 TaxID=2931351 RepID=UPI002041FC16|nr:ADP compounds hydrolase NudE [Kangiella sp. TOML190]